MSSLSIPFAEGEKVVLLRGSHISVGRFPDNTIQIEDRTVSGYHFELHFDRDHYRLHDRGSTNGVIVNGRRVEDFHLREETEVLIGSVRCVFHPGNSMKARADSIELLPVHEEVQATRRECQQLREQNAALREQVARMLAERPDGPTSQDELAAAYANLKLELATRREDVESLTTRVALLARDRDNLQRAYNDLKNHVPSGGGGPGASRIGSGVADVQFAAVSSGGETVAAGDTQTKKLDR